MQKQISEIIEELTTKLILGDCIFLQGGMGFGKTYFTKSLAKNLGARQLVNSPTYTLTHRYDCHSFTLIHTDLYRLTSSQIDLSLITDIYSLEAVSIIEWSDKIPSNFLPCFKRIFKIILLKPQADRADLEIL